ncbi:MAG: response regulator transcription factor [Lachnospiraceae bacterium]|nr:response regulator transcription factor [Lachnospiraceae bacterium]
MNYHIAVCDDSTADRQYIRNLLTEWAALVGHSVVIYEFSSAEQFMFEYEDKQDYDILLLDIEMGEMDGVTLAKKIRQVNEMVQIVFITGYSDYIAEGYEVAALHYLMKPVKQEKLFEVLHRAAEKVQKNEQCLTLENGGELMRIPLYQIRYVDVQHNYVTVHAKEEVTVKKTLGDIEDSLDERFFRVGRSAIVNLSCISRVTKTDIVLQDGTLVPLPRGAYEKVNRAIINMK